MVVQCTNCKARFRVADEKVPDKGVKVRCTKCTTVFKVTRADAMDPKAGQSRDPFTTSDTLRPTPTPPMPESTSVDDPFASSTATGNRVVPHMPPTVSLTYGAASPHQSLDLELSLGPPSASLAPMPRPTMPPMAPVSSTMPPMQMSSTMPPMRTASPLPMPPVPPMPGMDAFGGPGPLGDPFADLDIPPPRPPPMPAPVDPFAVIQPAAAAQAADPFAIDVGAPPPPSMMPPPPPSQAMMAPPPGPSMPPGPSPLAAGADPWLALMQAQPKREETDPFAGLSSPASAQPAPPPPPPAPAPAPPVSAPMMPPPPIAEAAAPPPLADATDDVPRLSEGGGLQRTAGTEFEFGEQTRGHKLDIDYEKIEQPPSLMENRREREKDGVELGRITALRNQKAAAAAAAAEEKNKAPDPKAVARSRFRKEVASMVFNVMSACVVLYFGIVAVAWVRSPRSIGIEDLGFPMVWLALGAGGSDPGDLLRATDIHSGIYPTNAGAELFYVSGLVSNDSDTKQSSLYAQVDIVRGDRVVGHADSLAVQPPPPERPEDVWPEHLWTLESRKNEDLQKTLVKEAPTLQVAPHNTAPFIAVFKLTAQDVEGCDVRVKVRSGMPPDLKSALSAPDAPAAPTVPPSPAAPKPTQTADARPKVP